MNDSLAEGLAVTHTENAVLPSGRQVEIPVCRATFQAWPGPSVLPVYGGKPVLKFDDAALYAELVVLRLLKNANWAGVWVDTFRNRYRSGPHEIMDIVEKEEMRSTDPVRKYPRGFEKFGGCWDVVAWKDGRVVFCECKRSKRDQIRGSQLEWLEARLNEGASIDDFLIVEWDLAGEAKQIPIAHETAAPFLPQAGRWYSYLMLPGYAGPYFSPIKVEHVELRGKTYKRLKIKFFNASYAQGVKDFVKDLKIVVQGERYLVGALKEESGSVGQRTAIIAELSSTWMEHLISRQYAEENPMSQAESQSSDCQGYLERLLRDGRI